MEIQADIECPIDTHVLSVEQNDSKKCTGPLALRIECRVGRGDSRNPSQPPPPDDGFRCALPMLRATVRSA